MSQILEQILADELGERAFALLYRPQVTREDKIEAFVGDISQQDSLESLPLLSNTTLVLVPYKQLNERNFACVDDDASLITMAVTKRETISIEDALKLIPNLSIELSEGKFDLDDDAYAEVVKRIIENEIGCGEGSNFVIKRVFSADITNYSIHSALAIFRQLIQNEIGTYWTFIIHTGNRTFVGASPELHVSLNKGIATMNPISGTYRYPTSGPTLEGVKSFLSTSKETSELYMVVEEELKMISRFCPQGGKVVGPFLKEMSRLAHTEYLIQGNTACDPRKILLETMFAPTVTGSPLENAYRIIMKYEPQGRGYYAGISALIERDASGNYNLDSTILIRTADIDSDGRVRIAVGATVVRDSHPDSEADETRAKANALLRAMNVEAF